jgi:hypothetical protein
MDVGTNKLSKKMEKIITSMNTAAARQDRNKSARDRLSKKFNETKTKASDSLTTTTITQSNRNDTTATNIHKPYDPSPLWTDVEIQKTIERMDPQQRHMYAKMGKELFKTGGIMDSINERKDTQSIVFESAEQIRLMLRDGLAVTDLTQDEIRTLVSALGPDEVKSLYGIDLNLSLPTENEQSDRTCYSVSVNTGKN